MYQLRRCIESYVLQSRVTSQADCADTGDIGSKSIRVAIVKPAGTVAPSTGIGLLLLGGVPPAAGIKLSHKSNTFERYWKLRMSGRVAKWHSQE
jgi:hypothetical protein